MVRELKVLDGGMGTSLSDMGLDLRGQLWSAKMLIENPDAIRLVHRQHAEAGADILTSASYQASLRGFIEAGYGASDYQSAIEVSALLAREVADEVGKEQGREILVAASVGPYGATLADGSEYHGNYGVSKEFLLEFHGTRLHDLLHHQPDYLAFETVPSFVELEAINELLSKDFPSVQAWVSCSARSSTEISDGTLFAEAIQVLTAPNIIARGINCTPPEFITPLLDGAVGPFIVYPNAGTWDAINRQWLEVEESSFANQKLQDWITRDVKILGGCCGLGAEYIKAVAGLLD